MTIIFQIKSIDLELVTSYSCLLYPIVKKKMLSILIFFKLILIITLLGYWLLKSIWGVFLNTDCLKNKNVQAPNLLATK